MVEAHIPCTLHQLQPCVYLYKKQGENCKMKHMVQHTVDLQAMESKYLKELLAMKKITLL